MKKYLTFAISDIPVFPRLNVSGYWSCPKARFTSYTSSPFSTHNRRDFFVCINLLFGGQCLEKQVFLHQLDNTMQQRLQSQLCSVSPNPGVAQIVHIFLVTLDTHTCFNLSTNHQALKELSEVCLSRAIINCIVGGTGGPGLGNTAI
jgi:hypothetical protein